MLTEQPVITGTARNPVIPRPAVDRVIPRIAVDFVQRDCAGQGVRPVIDVDPEKSAIYFNLGPCGHDVKFPLVRWLRSVWLGCSLRSLSSTPHHTAWVRVATKP